MYFLELWNTISALQCVLSIIIVTQRFKKRGFMVPTDGSPTDSSQDIPVTSASEDGHTTEETEESADQVSQPPTPPTHTHTHARTLEQFCWLYLTYLYACARVLDHTFIHCVQDMIGEAMETEEDPKPKPQQRTLASFSKSEQTIKPSKKIGSKRVSKSKLKRKQ